MGAPRGPKDKFDSFEAKLRGWIAVTMVLLGSAGGVGLFAFKTNAVADVQHERIQGQLNMTSNEVDRLSAVQRAILKKLDILQANQIRIGERLRVDGLVRGD